MIEFDFERDVERMLPKVISDDTTFKVDMKQRTIVCRHWLLGLCYKGEQCSHLHRLDKSKMPPCKHGNLCKIKNCPLKHIAEEELEECIFYKQGFCYNGPKCGRRHVKRTPEDCPAEVQFDSAGVAGQVGGGVKKFKTPQPNDNFKVTLCTHWLINGNCPFNNECHFAHGEEQINEGFQSIAEFLQDSDIFDPTSGRMDAPLQLPIPSTSRASYFVLQSPDLRSLAIAKRRGVWAVPLRMVVDINNAVRTSEYVILFFCCRPLRAIYGVAALSTLIPPGPQLGPAMSAEFPITWLRSMRVPLRTVAQLKLGQSGMFLGRSSTDGRFEPKIGMDMLLTAFRKPEWDWSATADVLAKAEQSIRLVETVKVQSSADGPEYYPTNGTPASQLIPANVLFAPDWIERAAAMPAEKGFGFRANAQANTSNVPDFYSGSLPGFVFCAITPVIEEMLGRQLFGLPMQMKDVTIQPNVPVFIFDSVAQMLLGIFYVDSPATMNMEPQAFIQWLGVGPGGGSPLPVQMRFRIALEAPPTPVQDPEILMALGGYAASLGGVLGVTETRNLANLFARRAQQMLAGSRGGPGKGQFAAGGGSGSGQFYQPPFRCVETVPVDIRGNMFDIKRKLLGTNASAIMRIVDECGSRNNLRVRIRGIGSGFLEGPQNQELQQPLHFNVSAENEQLLASAVTRLKAHIDQVRSEMQSI